VSRTAWQRKAPDFYASQGDTAPVIAEQLLDGAGNPAPLTGASVKLQMWLPGAAVAKVDAAATITDAALGKVSYTWTAPNLDTPGDYLAQWKVTYSGGAIERFPNSGYRKVRVSAYVAA
jgi:hypothetical protein